jgi:hypothetical protein
MRSVELSRDEAEMLVELLMLSDDHTAFDLAGEIRQRFGMISESQELKAMGKTLQEFQADWLRDRQERGWLVRK